MALILHNIAKQFTEGFSLNIKELMFQDSIIHAITGPKDSGKTVLLRIAGLLDLPDAGHISIAGNIPRQQEMLKGRIVYTTNKPYLFNTTVRENVACGLQRFRGLQHKQRLDTILEIAGLNHLAKRPVHYLTSGETRRVGLARAAAAGAEVILCDDPVFGLDSLAALQMENALRRINAKIGSCIVIATRDQEYAKNIAKQIFRLNHGQIVEVIKSSGLDPAAGYAI